VRWRVRNLWSSHSVTSGDVRSLAKRAHSCRVFLCGLIIIRWFSIATLPREVWAMEAVRRDPLDRVGADVRRRSTKGAL
jgi:hypothetical protein